MKLPRIPVLPWWAEAGLQVAVLVGMAVAAEIIERKRKELTDASSQEADDDEDTIEAQWWCS